MFVKLHFAWSIERAKPNTSKTEPTIINKSMKFVPKATPKSIFFWNPFGDAWRPRFWVGLGVDLGSILGPFWGQKSVWKRLEKSSKKWLKKVMQETPGHAEGLACGPLKETSQTGNWQPATGNWQDWELADLLGPIDTPLRALRGARWRISLLLSQV